VGKCMLRQETGEDLTRFLWNAYFAIAGSSLVTILACCVSSLVVILKSRTPKVRGVQTKWVPLSPWDKTYTCFLPFAQLGVPIVMFSVLSWMGAGDTEGAWARTPFLRYASLSLTWLPLVAGLIVTAFARGRRVPFLLCAIASWSLGCASLLGFLLIGT
jgi:hypothetical protein